MRSSGSAEKLDGRRACAVELLAQGHAPSEIADTVGVDRRSVPRRNAAYRRLEQATFKDNGPSALDAKDGLQMKRILLKGTTAASLRKWNT